MSRCVFTEVTPPAVTLFCLRFFLQGTCLIVGCGLYPAALHGRAMARSGRAPGALPAADGRPPARGCHRAERAGSRLWQVRSVLNILLSSTPNPQAPRQRPSTPGAASCRTSGLTGAERVCVLGRGAAPSAEPPSPLRPPCGGRATRKVSAHSRSLV